MYSEWLCKSISNSDEQKSLASYPNHVKLQSSERSVNLSSSIVTQILNIRETGLRRRGVCYDPSPFRFQLHSDLSNVYTQCKENVKPKQLKISELGGKAMVYKWFAVNDTGTRAIDWFNFPTNYSRHGRACISGTIRFCVLDRGNIILRNICIPRLDVITYLGSIIEAYFPSCKTFPYTAVSIIQKAELALQSVTSTTFPIAVVAAFDSGISFVIETNITVQPRNNDIRQLLVTNRKFVYPHSHGVIINTGNGLLSITFTSRPTPPIGGRSFYICEKESERIDMYVLPKRKSCMLGEFLTVMDSTPDFLHTDKAMFSKAYDNVYNIYAKNVRLFPANPDLPPDCIIINEAPVINRQFLELDTHLPLVIKRTPNLENMKYRACLDSETFITDIVQSYVDVNVLALIEMTNKVSVKEESEVNIPSVPAQDGESSIFYVVNYSIKWDIMSGHVKKLKIFPPSEFKIKGSFSSIDWITFVPNQEKLITPPCKRIYIEDSYSNSYHVVSNNEEVVMIST